MHPLLLKKHFIFPVMEHTKILWAAISQAPVFGAGQIISGFSPYSTKSGNTLKFGNHTDLFFYVKKQSLFKGIIETTALSTLTADY
ncbi:hypothetical protein HMPREF1141_0750 [Clostridium sp. MSTE9]|nr:hypothetical protein HMPREF1141_0750 [Clostridium sp. MSTE9]